MTKDSNWSPSGHLITVFGGGGFLGRYVIQRLLAQGARVRIAQRNPRQATFLRPLGNLGQTHFVRVDVRDPASCARAVAGCDAVVNLVGAFTDMDAIQHLGAGNVAAATAAAGIDRLVHVSAIGADADSPAVYGRSKGLGELAVRDALPSAIILRPSVVFGREDQFINRFAGMIRMLPVVPVVAGTAKFQPVFVGDVADAVVAALTRADARGRSFDLGGPQVMSMGEIFRWIARATGRRRTFVAVPDGVTAAMARMTGWLPGAPMTWDQWLMLQNDTVAGADRPGLAALGVTPTALDTVADDWLVNYRRHGRFAAPSQG